jgi:hypothetical protein
MSTQPAIFSNDEMLASHTLPFVKKEWRAKGFKLAKEHDHRQWELGEWMDEGVEGLTKKTALRLAMQITGYAQTTLWDFARTAKAFPNPESRRRELSWSHHKELAISNLSEELRSKLLDRAVEDRENPWSITRLRTEVKNELKRQKGEVLSKDLRKMPVSVNAATYKYFTKLAKERKERRDVLVGNLLNEKAAEFVG